MVEIPQRRASLAVPYQIILIFLSLSLLIALSGYLYYRNQKLHIKQELQQTLAAIADLKIKQIDAWRTERLADAKAIMENSLLVAEVDRWLSGGRSPEREKIIRAWMLSRLKNFDYSSVLLLDRQGNTLMAEPRGREKVGPGGRKAIAQAIQQKDVFLSDLHRAANEPEVHFDIVVPLMARNNKTAECSAVVFLRIDPYKFFYPMIQSWPTPSASAETLLVRRDGDKVVYLNELRHVKNTPLNLLLDVDSASLPAALAVQGKKGVVQGADYRGVPVLAALKSVPGTQWFMISKIDIEEIYRPVFEQARIIGLVVFLLITAAGITVYFFWRRQELEARQKQFEAEHERSIISQRYNELWQQANDSIILFDGIWNVVAVNDRALITYGYTRDEFLQLKAYELRAPEDRESLEADLKRAEKYGGFIYETLHQRKDGATFPVEVSLKKLETEGTAVYQSIIRDITERRAAEQALQESEQRIRHKLDSILSPEGDVGSLQLADIFDIPALQSLMDRFNQLVHMTMAILDIDGTVLVSAGFQDICTKFHRAHPDACRHCLESDTQLSAGVPEGECKLYKCQNNLWDIATPIYVGGRHVGNLFAGQFFFEDETPDYEVFREQARQYGFNEKEYLAALDAVPRFSREFVDSCMAFFIKFNDIISRLSYGNIKLARTLSERDALLDSLRESEERFKAIADYTVDWESWVGTDGHLLWVNPSVERITGYSPQECQAMLDYPLPLIHPEDRAALVKEFAAATRGDYGQSVEFWFIRKDGTMFWGSVSYQPIFDSAGRPLGHRSSVRDITERKRSEEALQESELRFKSIFDTAAMGISLLDPGGYVLMCNEARCRFLGYSSEELVGMHFSAFTHPDDLTLDEELFRDMQGGRRDYYTFEKRYIRKDGRTVWGRLNVSPVRDEGGGLRYTVAICEDITGQKQAVEALKQEEAKFRLMAENISEGLTIIGPDNTIFVNDCACEITGYPREELVNLKTTDIAAPECRRMIDEAFEKFSETNVLPEKLEFEIIRKDGSRRFISNRYSATILGGKVINRYVLTTDITGRKRVEDALRESESRFRSVVESAPEAIFIQTNKCFAYLNPMAVRLFGAADESELLGSQVMERFHPDFRAGVAERIRQLNELRTAVPEIAEKIVRCDGTWVDVEVSAMPFTYQEQNGALVFVRDITQRIKIEEESEKLRTQLIQAQKMEAIGHLAGGIAHDFNNILSAIIGYANLTEMKLPEEDPLRANLQQILASSERAANLVRSLLAFSRKQLINPKPVKLNDIVASTEKMLSRVIGEDIELRCNYSRQDIIALADAGQIDQILLNMATKARDAMPMGGSLTISTGVTEIGDQYIAEHGYGTKGSYAFLSVEDTGSGMTAAVREHVFEPFFTTKEVGKGTGLGLSTVYGIVKQHNGFVNCYSEPGLGTTFHIYLPLIEGSAAAEDEPRQAAPLTGGTETILLAEDDQAIRDLSRTILEKFGYRVIEARDGEDAIEKFRACEHKIQLLLLDVVMPKKNGREVFEAIQQLQPGIKVLFISGYTADIIHKRGFIEEGFPLMTKPASMSELLKAVRNALDR